MNKRDLIERMAEQTGMTRVDCKVALDGLLDVVTQALREGEKIKLSGFGAFEIKRRAAKTGRNPQTMETVTIPARDVPVFKAGKDLREKIGGGAVGRAEAG